MTQLLKTKLLFIDSDTNSLNGVADRFNIDLPSQSLICGDRQFIRLTLQDFHMSRNFYTINDTNNGVMVKSTSTGTTFNRVNIPAGDYEVFYGIANAFGIALTAQLNATEGAGWTLTTASTTPVDGIYPSSTGNKIFSVRIAKTAHALTSLVLQCRDYTDPTTRVTTADFNDSYKIFGAYRVIAASDTQNSFVVDLSQPNWITISGYSGMQRATMEHIYLRTNLVGDNLASRHFAANQTNHQVDMNGTDILGKIPVQFEYASYSDLTGDNSGWFVDLNQKSLTQASFYLSDSKNRIIPAQSAQQKTIGNYTFTMVIRASIYMLGAAPLPNEAILPPPPLPHGRYNNGLVTGYAERGRIPR